MRINWIAHGLWRRLQGLFNVITPRGEQEDSESKFLSSIARLELILSTLPVADDCLPAGGLPPDVESPASIILLSWRKLEAELNKVRRSHRLEFTVNEHAGVPNQFTVAELLRVARFLTSDQHLIIEDLLTLRNQVARCKYAPDKATAKRYRLIVLRISELLRYWSRSRSLSGESEELIG